jgi:hypothetical protein
MVEDALRESLSTSITTQVSGETYCQNKWSINTSTLENVEH